MSTTVQTDVSQIIWDESLDQNKNYFLEPRNELNKTKPYKNLPNKSLLTKVDSLVNKQEIRKATNKLLDYLSEVPNDKKANDMALKLLKSRGWKI